MIFVFFNIIFFKFYFIFKLYIIVLVLPNIKMNPPQVYMCFLQKKTLALPTPHQRIIFALKKIYEQRKS